MAYADKILRIREAREKDEQPLLDAFRKWGFEAQFTHGSPMDTKRKGDVIFWRSGWKVSRAIESQVSRKHKSFSYTADKVNRYGGNYVLLGCLEDAPSVPGEATPMFFAIVEAPEFHQALLSGDIGKLSETNGMYFIIRPTELALLRALYMGPTIEAAVERLVADLPGEGPAGQTLVNEE